MAIEIADFHMKIVIFHSYVSLPIIFRGWSSTQNRRGVNIPTMFELLLWDG